MAGGWVVIETSPELAMLDALDEGVVAIDDSYSIVFFNRSAERMFGYSSLELLGRPLDVLLPEAHRAAHRSQVEGFRRDGPTSRKMSQRTEVAGRRKSGETFDAEASIAKTTIDGRRVLMAVVRDVTRRKKAEARLRDLEQRQRTILETCGDAIVLVDTETGRVIDANSRAGVLFGCDLSELIGVHRDDLHSGAGPRGAAARIRTGAESGPEPGPVAAIRRRDGTLVPVEVTHRVTDIEGRSTLVEFVRDISYHKERERELVEAREAARLANESKTRFLANMSHELRTPLNAVIGMSEMIRDAFWGPLGHPKYAEYAADINDSGRHLLDLINDILDLSRIELDKVPLRDEPIDLGELVDQCRRTVMSLIRERGLTWSNRMSGAEILLGDRRAVRQMLLNLLSNAIKHTPKGGEVSVIAGPGPNGGLALTVADTGAGIPADRLSTITEPFNLDIDISVSRQGGAGLGLTITKRLLERHGGELLVDSRVGEGTTVHLMFPDERLRSRDDVSGRRTSAE
ncbi:hypothetical protein GCM10017083_40410 [Thalassobaculum fulvum]|uniref:histidine kinase n=1 Tax=Thalassobaculum fulvum TaxID=1633335 RepID=A0A918XVG9_9PROT|nr:hypothetical protein GCM10017083_40410 [Thalassobaculum fulvum]